jgi:hypothetical protein
MAAVQTAALALGPDYQPQQQQQHTILFISVQEHSFCIV